MYIHFIAIGGAIMHQLAIALLNKGNQITGSDDVISDPAYTNLLQKDILPDELGWFPNRINSKVDAVILGMHAKADNPELMRAQELNIPIYSFPEFIYEFAKDKKRVVIAGSHGKTTTTSMVMHALQQHHTAFDYLVGAKVDGFAQAVKLSEAPLIVLEGDEYPASVIEKRPKIHFYHPQISVITGVAWDHINVFPTLDIYKQQFSLYLKSMEEGAVLIYNELDETLQEIIRKDGGHLQCIPYAYPAYEYDNEQLKVTFEEVDYYFNVFGIHNLQNMTAARLVCAQLGISTATFYNAMQSYGGAAKRLELIVDEPGYKVIRDFAHAPSKLKATIKAVAEKYHNYHIIACFELHTYSSFNEAFLKEYAHSMDAIEHTALFYSAEAMKNKNMPPLDKMHVKASFEKENMAVFTDKEALEQWISKIQSLYPGQAICMLYMSSGTFDGIEFK